MVVKWLAWLPSNLTIQVKIPLKSEAFILWKLLGVCDNKTIELLYILRTKPSSLGRINSPCFKKLWFYLEGVRTSEQRSSERMIPLRRRWTVAKVKLSCHNQPKKIVDASGKRERERMIVCATLPTYLLGATYLPTYLPTYLHAVKLRNEPARLWVLLLEWK